MAKSSTYKGFSLIEIILAVSIFALSVMGLTGGLIYGQQSSLSAVYREQATLYASEGIHASTNIADESFNNLVDGEYGLSIENNIYNFKGAPDILDDIYNRQISISSIDANTKQINSLVIWTQSGTEQGRVLFITYITNWK